MSAARFARILITASAALCGHGRAYSAEPSSPQTPPAPRASPAPHSQVLQSQILRTGPHRVASGEYRLAAKIDADILSDQATEIWAKAYWPEDIKAGAKAPILFLLHGNHSTCGSGRNPRVDSDCTYTTEGICPDDMVVTPNHLGYEYIGEHMASFGYVVVSINANRAITCGYGNSDDYGLIGARGKLILKHASLWNEWATNGNLPASLGVPAEAFVGTIDFSNVGLFGHSRGGEGARAAYSLANGPGNPWAAKIPGLKIKGIFEIGGSDGLSKKAYDALGVAWTQLLPLCDGDIADLAGRRPFERMLRATSESEPTPKSLYYAWGTNHNFFNSEWQENDSYGCENHQLIFPERSWESGKQRAVGLAAVSDFFRAFVGTKPVAHLARHFNPAYKIPKAVSDITNIDRDYSLSPANLFTMRLEEFTKPTGLNSSGEMNSAHGIEIEHEKDYATGTSLAKIVWDRGGDENFFQSNWTAKGKGKSVDGFASLDFRVSRAKDEQRNATPQTDFSIQLVHSDDSVSAPVRALQYGTIRGPVSSMIAFQTVRVPLTAFSGSRLNDIRGVKFIFNRTSRGSLFVTNIRFTSKMNGDGIVEPAPRSLSTPLANAAALQSWLSVRLVPATTRAKPGIERRRAFVLKGRFVRKSVQLNGGSAVELTLISVKPFPVINDLPIFKIGEREYRATRFDRGNTRKLIVSIPATEWAGLRSGLPVELIYGSRLRFKLSDFDRGWLKR